MNESTHQPHSKISTTPRHPLEVVHTNVTGPVSPPSFSGSRYAVIYTDSATRTHHIYFIRSKSGVFNTLWRYRTDVTANTRYRIKTLRSDNGSECTGRNISTYCTHHNIRQEFTTPTPPKTMAWLNDSGAPSSLKLALSSTTLTYPSNFGLKLLPRPPTSPTCPPLPPSTTTPPTTPGTQPTLTCLPFSSSELGPMYIMTAPTEVK
ncbi:unnamed protein product [Choristocarpus tenellus]